MALLDQALLLLRRRLLFLSPLPRAPRSPPSQLLLLLLRQLFSLSLLPRAELLPPSQQLLRRLPPVLLPLALPARV